ncbi:hepatocyte growth factor activator isoform X2 [Corvus cornix cornix]|uniref:hepatocyte growth factor activator isoform X2 n=1 Tax=Corvus brachyrhynchos TaxID=85066 RepID=UPI0008166C9E|nr:PREDICTED: hepatocyte growth factor activator isoform X2 [Corvus brachyrhynchos]XP_019142957.3 hepatocyte growth factor activator isoform X2 [Corvus cornix cornix]
MKVCAPLTVVLALTLSSDCARMHYKSGAGRGSNHGFTRPQVFTEDGRSCKFPFRFGGRFYHTCLSNMFSRKKWCSTTHNFDRDRRWGHCALLPRDHSDHCADNPCQNGGTCSLTHSHRMYHCTCPEEFTGEDCQLSCIHASCMNGGECKMVASTGQIVCDCKENYAGKYCNIVPSQRCYTGNGTDYRGTAKTTISGHSCLPWNSDLLYQELHVDSIGKAVQLGLGPFPYCRNPDDDDKPWCYIMKDNSLSWAYCDIPTCASRERRPPIPDKVDSSAGTKRPCGRRHKKRSFVRPRIVGGSSSLPGSHPWTAAIYIGESFCGGSLVQTCWVVSAAHCFANSPLKSTIRVVLGQQIFNKTTDVTQTFEIEKYILHPQYSVFNPTEHDIALIKLKKNGQRCAVKSQFVQPICLPESDTIFPDLLKCQISGWGHKHENISGYSDVLQETLVPLIPEEKCRSSEIYGTEITENMFCAGYFDSKSDACQGDSGGPLACEKNDISYLYGIISWGDGCGRVNKPGVYTRVTNYVKWINEKIAPRKTS